MMSISNLTNRWLVVVGAILIQLALGAIYAWSVFTKLLTEEGGVYQFSASQAAWIFSICLLVFSIVMVFAGKWQFKVGPRKVAMIGGIVLGLGYLLAGFFGGSFWPQLLFIGVVGGAGIGLAYVVPLAVGVKWFPDKKGMITGFAVAGFGFGATIWVKLAGSWFGGLLNTTSLFGLPNVQSVFLIYGITFAALVLLGSLVMVNPPDDFKPLVSKEKETKKRYYLGHVNYSPSEMLHTRQFYSLWTVFMFSALAGLMVIYCISLFGIDALRSLGIKGAAGIAGTAMASYAIFNGLGRILWGTFSDRTGRKIALTAMCVLQGLMMFALYYVVMLGGNWGLIIAASIIGFNFGGNFAMFPAVTADMFGNKRVGSNYGWVFSAYGIAGVLGPLIAGYFKDAAKIAEDPRTWLMPFMIAAVFCFIGAMIMMFTHLPKKTEDGEAEYLRHEKRKEKMVAMLH